MINVPISIASAIAASAVPTLTAAYQVGNDKQVRYQIHSATRFIMMIAFPCTVGMAVLAGPIMMFLFSDSDPTSGRMLTVGAISILFYSLSTLSNGLLQGIDRLKIPVRNAAISLVLQAVFLVVALELFDQNIYAVIYANAFYAFCMCVLNHWAVVKYSGVHQNIYVTYLLPATSSLVMGLSVFLIYRLLHVLTHSNAISTIASMAVGVVVYFLVMLLTKGISKKDVLRLPKGDLLYGIAHKFRLM